MIDRYLLFFFKQKTAYEMRISDWSSDVCSSDLVVDQLDHLRGFGVRDTNDGARQAAEERCCGVRALGGEAADDLRQNGKLSQGVPFKRPLGAQIGRAACRDRVCQYV